MKHPLPSEIEEVAQAAAKGAVSAIPVFGGLVAELGACLLSPVEARKREWAEEIQAGLLELKARYGRLPETLTQDPVWVSALFQATGIAVATHQYEKKVALRRFIVSVGARASGETLLNHTLPRLIETCSVGHIEILKFLDTQAETPKLLVKVRHGQVLTQWSTLLTAYKDEYKGLLSQNEIIQILLDLETYNVIQIREDLRKGLVRENLRKPTPEFTLLVEFTALGEAFLNLLYGENETRPARPNVGHQFEHFFQHLSDDPAPPPV